MSKAAVNASMTAASALMNTFTGFMATGHVTGSGSTKPIATGVTSLYGTLFTFRGFVDSEARAMCSTFSAPMTAASILHSNSLLGYGLSSDEVLRQLRLKGTADKVMRAFGPKQKEEGHVVAAPEPEAQDSKTEAPAAAEDEKKKEEDDDEDKKKKPPFGKHSLTDEEVVESDLYKNLAVQFTQLQKDLEALKAEVEPLRTFKVEADRKAKQDMIDSFYMLSDEDKKDCVENIDTYSLDDIEAKLSIICVRNKVSFSLDDDKKETSKKEPTIYELNGNDGEDNAPAWIKAVRNTAKEMN